MTSAVTSVIAVVVCATSAWMVFTYPSSWIIVLALTALGASLGYRLGVRTALFVGGPVPIPGELWQSHGGKVVRIEHVREVGDWSVPSVPVVSFQVTVTDDYFELSATAFHATMHRYQGPRDLVDMTRAALPGERTQD